MTTQTDVSGFRIQIDKIKRDGGTQSRAALDDGTLHRYAEAMKAGEQFPPVELLYDGTDYWLWDGFHRLEAATVTGQTDIAANVQPGTRRDAVLKAAGANATHGLPRSDGDKRRAVTTLLQDEEWRAWSDRKIAETCRCSHGFVGKLRADLYPDGMPERTVERGGKSYTMQTGAINEDRSAAVTDEARTIVRKVLANGQLHRNVIEGRARDLGVDSRTVAATLQAMIADHELYRYGLMYALPELPESTRTSADADRIFDYLALHAQPIPAIRVRNFLSMDDTDFNRAVMLLEADGRLARSRATGAPAALMLTAVVPPPMADDDVDEPHGEDSESDAVTGEDAALPVLDNGTWYTSKGKRLVWVGRDDTSDPRYLWRVNIYWTKPGTDEEIAFGASGKTRLEAFQQARHSGARVITSYNELNAAFDHNAITLLGRSDQGAWHRAIEIARKLVAAGLWDGHTHIEIDAYSMHDQLFGVNRREPVAADFQIVAANPLRDLILSVLSTGAASVKTIGRAGVARTGRNITDGALSTVVNDLLIEGAVIMLDSDTDGAPLYALPGAAEPVVSPASPRHEPDQYRPIPVSVDTAREMIIDAIRNSHAQTLIYKDTIFNWTGIELRDYKTFETAFQQMIDGGAIKEGRTPGGKRGYHFADVVDRIMQPASAADQLETVLINAASAIDLALKAAAPDWSQVDPARQDELRDLLRQTSEAAARLIERIEVTWWPPEGTSDAA